jgi:shikimate kinase / 3-dehydroquinate synthase
MEALDHAHSRAAAPAAGERRVIVLVGFMGSGKSTTARMLAAELGVESVDSDREIERELGEPIEEFFDREGEAAFRAREEQVVLRLLEAGHDRVVALGGGSLGSDGVRDALRHHLVVHLEVEPEEAWRRASNRARPLARDRMRFDQLHRERAAVYDASAHVTLPSADRNLPRRALGAVTALRDAPPATRLVWAPTASGEYPVFFGRGLVASGFFYPQEARRFVVTDANVAARHRITGETTIEIPPGESEKTLARAEEVLRELARAGATRGDLVVAVGGGVVGDLAGFCAAVYQRGMRHAQVPTTLVAQVDSAFGGKTGVDLPEGKNYVGAYHQPSAVLVDPATLGTLPAEEAAAGYAEVVKTALIAGGRLWAHVRAGGEPDDEAILGCLRTKLRIVSEDERDSGRRQVLNLGHTVGHAIEAATGYRRYRHGEAIGLGLLAALRLSERDTLRAEVAELLAARGLPQHIDGASADEIVSLVQRDKKRVGRRVPFVLVEAPGEVTPGHEVDDDALRASIEELTA